MSQSATLNLHFVCVGQLTIVSASPPNPVLGVPYGPFRFQAAGDVPPYRFSLEDAQGRPTLLPPGMTLSPDGDLGGTCTALGETDCTIKVRGSSTAGT